MLAMHYQNLKYKPNKVHTFPSSYFEGFYDPRSTNYSLFLRIQLKQVHTLKGLTIQVHT